VVVEAGHSKAFGENGLVSRLWTKSFGCFPGSGSLKDHGLVAVEKNAVFYMPADSPR